MVNHYWDGGEPAATACGDTDGVEYVSTGAWELVSCSRCLLELRPAPPATELIKERFGKRPPPPPADNVNSPNHYTWLGGIEVIQITEHLGFCLGNVVKYVLRADHKGEPIQDLEKAAWYLQRELENRKKTRPER